MPDQVRVHVALNVRKFEESVKFYRAMFGVEPVKWKPGYAKFDVAEPPLNLTLNYQREAITRGALNHLGIEVDSTVDVLAAKKRLTEAGLVTRDEMNVDCCFALQDKIWVTDPDGNRWEVFTVKIADTSPELQATEGQSQTQSTVGCCQAATS
jgi:catechol 2,3-dioxygenase-like lactoylglutathione lyase family enzyme